MVRGGRGNQRKEGSHPPNPVHCNETVWPRAGLAPVPGRISSFSIPISAQPLTAAVLRKLSRWWVVRLRRLPGDGSYVFGVSEATGASYSILQSSVLENYIPSRCTVGFRVWSIWTGRLLYFPIEDFSFFFFFFFSCSFYPFSTETWRTFNKLCLNTRQN